MPSAPQTVVNEVVPMPASNPGAKTIPLAARRSARTGSVRINAIDDKADEAEIDPDSLPKDSFSEEDMQRIWNERVKHLFGSKPSLLSSLTKRAPKLADTHLIELTLDSEHELETVNLNKTALLDIIRKDLNNFSVQLQTPVEVEIHDKRAYTPKEKYEKMLGANPHLDMLREKFGLELDI
jgi:DNA polymerase-3 subunit gamma/tau